MVISSNVALCPKQGVWHGTIHGITKDGTEFLYAATASHRVVVYQQLFNLLRDLARNNDWIEI